MATGGEISLSLQIMPHVPMDTDGLDQLTQRLSTEIEDLGVESVTRVQANSSYPGAKGADPVTIGALFVIVLQTALPKVLDYIQAWSLRNEGEIVKIKVQGEKRSVELEFPKEMTPEELQNHIRMVVSTVMDQDKTT